MHERLVLVAHGTASPSGLATTRRLVAAVAAARPHVTVELCFLDVAEPRLPDVLAGTPEGPDGTDGRPTVVVPLLLSTGYHVRTDIPAAVAPYPQARVARHLGPDPLLIDALLDRLPPGPGPVVLVGAGSSRPEARAELVATARLLGERLGATVPVATMADDLAALFAGPPPPPRIATYLLAEGQFVTTLRAAAGGRGQVAPALGVHPALVELVWQRYDEAAQATR